MISEVFIRQSDAILHALQQDAKIGTAVFKATGGWVVIVDARRRPGDFRRRRVPSRLTARQLQLARDGNEVGA